MAGHDDGAWFRVGRLGRLTNGYVFMCGMWLLLPYVGGYLWGRRYRVRIPILDQVLLDKELLRWM